MTNIYSKLKIFMNIAYPIYLSLTIFLISGFVERNQYCEIVESTSGILYLTGYMGSFNTTCIMNGAFLFGILFFSLQLFILVPVKSSPLALSRLSQLTTKNKVFSTLIITYIFISLAVTPIENYSEKYNTLVNSIFNNPLLFSAAFIVSQFYLMRFWALIITSIYFNKDI